MNTKPNLIVDLSFAFSLKVIAFTEKLESERKFNMANQLFRCGTSIGANVREAQGAESKAILDINAKSPIKKQKKRNTGFSYVNTQKAIRLKKRCMMIYNQA